jgi:hypothetical protein
MEEAWDKLDFTTYLFHVIINTDTDSVIIDRLTKRC